MSGGERVGWLFLLIPLAGFVCAALVTNAFTDRYFIGTLPGVAVAFASLMYRVWHDRAEATALVCIILLGFGGVTILAKNAASGAKLSRGQGRPSMRKPNFD